MKNIHTLPTDKPSRLVLDTVNNNLFATTTKDFGTNIMKFQNIYITSDEEAKEGDWGYIPFQGGNVKLVGKYFADDWKKIILTTDQDLIEDGVQAIDDEFLEWFVKNPSCEEVEVDKVPVNEFGSEITVNGYGFDKFKYKIIIPKETLEEAAKKLFGSLEKGIGADRRLIWMNGAKWQQERSYSEEEILELLQKALTHRDNGETGNLITAQGEIRTANFYSWFEQNKKK